MRGIVIVLFRLDTRIGKMGNLDIQTGPFSLFRDHGSQLNQRKLLGYLVKDTILTLSGRRQQGQLDTSDGIAHIEIAPRLLALTIDGKRVSGGGLDTETIKRRAIDLIVIEARGQPWI